jgi:hypothetical protein
MHLQKEIMLQANLAKSAGRHEKDKGGTLQAGGEVHYKGEGVHNKYAHGSNKMSIPERMRFA